MTKRNVSDELEHALWLRRHDKRTPAVAVQYYQQRIYRHAIEWTRGYNTRRNTPRPAKP